MKKILSAVLVVLLLVSLCACGNSSTASNTSSPESEVSNDMNSETSSITSSAEQVSTPEKKPFVAPEPVTLVDAGKQYIKYHADDISLFKYCGHWQAEKPDEPHTLVCYWNIAYVEVDFTGDHIMIELTKESTFKTSIDGGDYVSHTASGFYTIKAEGTGKHTLRILNDKNHNNVYFAGAAVPITETMTRTADKAHYVQFIGDSISMDARSFPFYSGVALDWDYAVAAQGAMSLRNGAGYLYTKDGSPDVLSRIGKSVGMETAFLKLGYPVESMSDERKDFYGTYFDNDAVNYNFETGYAPDIVFIFIGTNDGLTSLAPKDDFVAKYTAFVDKILAMYGNETTVVMMNGVSTSGLDTTARYDCIRAAAESCILKHPDNIKFIDRDVLETWSIDISSDNTHPSGDGYATLCARVTEYLSDNFQ